MSRDKVGELKRKVMGDEDSGEAHGSGGKKDDDEEMEDLEGDDGEEGA